MVDFDSFKNLMTSPAWKHGFESQNIGDFLGKFKGETASFDLKVLGLLWCQGEANDKAKCLLRLVGSLG